MTKPATKTNTDGKQPTLKSVGTDPQWSVCGPVEARQDWGAASQAGERNVKRLEGERCHIWYSQEAVNLYVLSLLGRRWRGHIRVRTLTRSLTSSHACRRAHTPLGDRWEVTAPPRRKREGTKDVGELGKWSRKGRNVDEAQWKLCLL